ncbi:hypothetical protein PIB30_079403 [Stylosanthes scabra]|uniref:Uncharacterized protein n=1 Tax=Stylosanthes scabra TaxID=79078 RepID=A0ABU6ST32_9FABA|nr:hypothetical protein [Stylosanthes scabra]
MLLRLRRRALCGWVPKENKFQRCLVIDQVQSLDLKRTSIFTLSGFILMYPTLHFCYCGGKGWLLLLHPSSVVIRVSTIVALFLNCASTSSSLSRYLCRESS